MSTKLNISKIFILSCNISYAVKFLKVILLLSWRETVVVMALLIVLYIVVVLRFIITELWLEIKKENVINYKVDLKPVRFFFFLSGGEGLFCLANFILSCNCLYDVTVCMHISYLSKLTYVSLCACMAYIL